MKKLAFVFIATTLITVLSFAGNPVSPADENWNKIFGKLQDNKFTGQSQQLPLDYKYEALADLLMPVLKGKGVEADHSLAVRICGMVKERCHFVSEIWDQSYFLFQAPTEYDPKIVSKRWRDDVPSMMTEIADFISQLPDWKAPVIKEEFSAFVTGKDWNFGTIMNSLRLCLVGGSFGPDIFEICEIIGKEETINRIQTAISNIK